MKVLYTATSDIHLYTFHLPYLRWLKDQGAIVHLAFENRGNKSFEMADSIFHFPFPRTPFSRLNVVTYRKLIKLIEEQNYQLIHCHTPMPGVLTRLAARKARGKNCRVFYTAHGFHFFKGAPILNWLMFYPVERWLAKFTDVLFTINREDANYASAMMKHGKAVLLPGIGADNSRFHVVNDVYRKAVREAYGYHDGHFLILYIAEFIPRKNHRFLLECLPELVKKIPSVRILLAGNGVLLDDMMNLAATLGVTDYLQFLGFVQDVSPLAASVDVGISVSKQEGLGLGLAEIMLCGVPVVATSDRGHKELIVDNETGIIFPQQDKASFIQALTHLYHHKAQRERLGNQGMLHAQKFTVDHALSTVTTEYREVWKDL